MARSSSERPRSAHPRSADDVLETTRGAAEQGAISIAKAHKSSGCEEGTSKGEGTQAQSRNGQAAVGTQRRRALAEREENENRPGESDNGIQTSASCH